MVFSTPRDSVMGCEGGGHGSDDLQIVVWSLGVNGSAMQDCEFRQSLFASCGFIVCGLLKAPCVSSAG